MLEHELRTCPSVRCRFTVKWIKMGSATQAEIEAAVASELLPPEDEMPS
jgi:hypothetical protein